MKKIVLIAVMLLCCICFTAYSQQKDNVTVILKNGTKITGVLKSMSPSDGAVVAIAGVETVIPIADIEEIKENAATPSTSHQSYSVTQPVSNDESYRQKMKDVRIAVGHYIGSRNAMKDAINVSFSICVVPSVKDKLCEPDCESVLADGFTDSFNWYMSIATNPQYTFRLTTDPANKYSATLYIVDIDDNDGETYGYIEYSKDGKLVLTDYFNNNGENGDTLFEKVKNSISFGACKSAHKFL